MATFGLINSGESYPSAGTVEIVVPTTGQSKTISAGTNFFIIDPAGSILALTVVMPAAPVDRQEVKIASDQNITALTLSPNSGQSILNVPTTLALGGFCGYIWIASKSTWYRVS